MRMNSSGKVLTVFLVIIAFLLISMTAISVFLYQKEIENRKSTEIALQKTKETAASLDEELKKVKKENFLFQEKAKEADEKINDLSDELELEKGLREEVKLENASLKDNLDKVNKRNDELVQKMAAAEEEKQQKIAELMDKLKKEGELRAQAESRVKEMEGKTASVNVPADTTVAANAVSPSPPAPALAPAVDDKKDAVNLDKIVVMPPGSPEGRVLTVDNSTEFVIINLGEKDGVKSGNILSIYRGKEYLGDVKVTSVQPEMSAADIIPPFTSQQVRKNDQVVLKQ